MLNRSKAAIRIPALLGVALLAIATLQIVGESDAEAARARLASSRLPTARFMTSAVQFGSDAYIFGGAELSADGIRLTPISEILRYTPSSDSVATMSGALPVPVAGTAAVSYGSNIFVFGGWTNGSDQDRIYRYSPATDSVTEMTARLPTGRAYLSGTFDGTNIFLFGGNSGSRDILKYDPAADEIELLPTRLPVSMGRSSAIFDGTYSNVFGGADDDIVRFDSTTGIALVVASLPVSISAAVWTGTVAYLFSNSFNWQRSFVYRFDPETLEAVLLSENLPGRAFMSGVWSGGNAYLFGGAVAVFDYDDFVNWEPNDEIVVFNPYTPGAPALGVSQDDQGAFLLDWEAPSDEGASPVTGYRIYRSFTQTFDGGELIAEVGPGERSFVDACPQSICFYRIVALNDAGEGQLSNEVPTSPDEPRLPSATGGPGRGEITITWQPPLSDGGANLTRYEIYGTIGWCFCNLGTVPADSLTFTESGLADGVSREYRVKAVNGAGHSWSQEVQANTYKTAGNPWPWAESGPERGQITLSWTPQSTDGGTPVTAYRIYKGTDSSSQVFLAEVPSSVSSYLDSGLPDATVFYYSVSSVNQVGEGARSPVTSASTPQAPGAPQNLRALPGSSLGEIHLTWEKFSNGGTAITGYVILRAVEGDPEVVLEQVGIVSSYSDFTCPFVRECRYRIIAVNSVGAGPPSNEAGFIGWKAI